MMRADLERGVVALDAFLSRDARNFRPSAIRAFAKLINDPKVISFAGGVPSPETFPADRVAQIAERVRAKRETMIEALQHHFAGRASWTPADGGLFTFVTLVSNVDTAMKVERAVAGGVAYIPGASFFVDGSGHNTMRLTFAKEPDARIRDGIARLAWVFA
jgi:DNA-binding transcriptional MocR family regulator